MKKSAMNMSTTRMLVTTCVTLLLLGSVVINATAASYKWRDKNGNVVYSQQPPAEGPYERLDTIRPSRSSPSTRAPTTTAARRSILDEAKSREEKSKVDTEVAKAQAVRQKNCNAAKKNLETYTVYNRVRNEKGEVMRLDDTVRAQKINEAKKAIAEFCN